MSVYYFFVCLLNFFFLDRDPKECAKHHGDKHLNKMQLEYAQIVSTVFWLIHEKTPFLDEETKGKIYKPTHKHHPVVKWATQSSAHTLMIIDVGLALAKEKEARALVAKRIANKKWKTTHKSTAVLEWIRTHMPRVDYFELGDMWVDPPACMPECLQKKGADVVDCYRLFYTGYKIRVTGISWRPYAQEPWFLEECRQRLSNMPDVEEDITKQEK
jgi:hypothetical protein